MTCIHTISFLCGVPKLECAEISGNADKDCGLVTMWIMDG